MKTRLFFIIYTFTNGGGAETLLATVMNGLYRTGRYDIGVMEIVHYGLKEEPIDEGIRVYPYYVREDAKDRKIRIRDVYRAWDKVINEHIPMDYDIYVSFNYLLPTFMLPKNKKTVAWIHGDVYDLVNRYPNQKVMTDEIDLQREAFRKVDRIVAISDITEQSLRELFQEQQEKIRVIYNGINTDRVRNLAKEAPLIRLETPAIVFVGRLDENKNPLRMLEIFRKISEKRGDVNLYYLGKGELREQLEDKIKKYNLSERAFLLGYVKNPYPIIRQANVLVMTSISEGFPMALLESVTLGVPFVTSLVGGSRILSNHRKCGLVFETDDEAVDGICYYLDGDENEVRSKSLNFIEKFTLEKYIKKIERLFEELIQEE